MEEEKSTVKTIKDTTKDIVGKLLSLFQVKKSDDEVTEKSPSKQIVKGILKLLVENEAERKSDFKEEMSATKREERDVEKRHGAILRALTIRRKPVGRKVKKKEEKPSIKVKKRGAKETPTQPTTPTATPTLTAPATSPIASVAKGAVLLGLAGATASVKAKIAGKESAGTSDKSYNIMNLGVGEKSGRDNVFELTSMTIPEVIKLGEERGKKFNKSGMGKAAGKYQFMPATLETYAKKVFRDKWRETKYSADNQELLMDQLIADNAQTLAKNGVPVSDVTLYAMHFTGSVNQANKIATSPDTTKMTDILSPAGQRANPAIAKMTVGGYRDWLKRGGMTFENITIVPPQNDSVVPQKPTTGVEVNTSSVRNNNMKSEASEQSPVNKITNNVGVNESNKEQKTPKVVNDSSPYERVAKG